MHHRCLLVTPEAMPPGTQGPRPVIHHMCVCASSNSAPPLTEDRGNWFSSLLKRTICYFLKEKSAGAECWWCKLSCLNTHRVQTAVPFQWSVIIRESFPSLWWMVCFWTLNSVHLQHNSIKLAAWRNLLELWHQLCQNWGLDCANFASSLFVSLKLHFLCRTNSVCDAVVTVWCYLCSYWVWLLLLWEWGGSESSYQPRTAVNGEEERVT